MARHYYRLKARAIFQVYTFVEADDELHAKSLAAEKQMGGNLTDWVYDNRVHDEIVDIEVDGVL
jgi:hypothetical protein